MTETDLTQLQVEAMLSQIKAMLTKVAGHNTVPAADMQDDLLDLLNMASELEGSDQ
jgi:hypothetical protein